MSDKKLDKALAQLPSAEDFSARVTTIVTAPELTLKWTNRQEASLIISQMRLAQKQLRLIKQEVRNVMKAIRSTSIAHNKTMKLDPGATFWVGRGMARQLRAGQRENLRRQVELLLLPYQQICDTIDHWLLDFDHRKLQIDQWLMANRH